MVEKKNSNLLLTVLQAVKIDTQADIYRDRQAIRKLERQTLS